MHLLKLSDLFSHQQLHQQQKRLWEEVILNFYCVFEWNSELDDINRIIDASDKTYRLPTCIPGCNVCLGVIDSSPGTSYVNCVDSLTSDSLQY